MSHQFYNPNGTPINQESETFGGLSNSLIFPGPSSFQQNVQPGWPSTPVWQMPKQERYNSNNISHGQMQGENGYVSNQQNAEDYDDSDDFYDNGEDTIMEQRESAMNFKVEDSRTNSFGGQQSQSNNKTRGTNETSSTSGQIGQQQQQQTKIASTPSNTIDPEAVGRLAELRAKLLESKSRVAKPPTPEVKNKKNEDLPSSQAPKENGVKTNKNKQQASSEKSAMQARSRAVESKAAITVGHPGDYKVDKSSIRATPSASPQKNSSADIDALFDEARAIVAASEVPDTRKAVTPVKQALSIRKANEQANGTAEKQDVINKSQIQPASRAESRPASRRPSNSSTGGSQTSEQGEIREDDVVPKPASEPRGIVETVTKKALQTPQNLTWVNAKLQKNKQTPVNVEGSQRAATTKKPKDAQLAKPQNDFASSKARDAPPQSSPTDHRDKPSKLRPVDIVTPTEDRPGVDAKAADRERIDRARIDRERAKESSKENRIDQFKRKLIEENERQAAEYKRWLRATNEEQSPQKSTIKPAAQSPAAGEYFADIDDWLEITGYHDQAYRKKALSRHRKLIELDKQRAELEREAQMDMEERSHIARAQSIAPNNSIESPLSRNFPSFSSRTVSNSSMPPPPTPLKENNKSAILHSNLSIQQSPTTLTPSLKRQFLHDSDDPMSIDSATKSGPPAAKKPSLESRIEDPRRSPSPGSSISRRISMSDTHMRNGFSPRPSRDSSPGGGVASLPYDDAPQYQQNQSSYRSRGTYDDYRSGSGRSDADPSYDQRSGYESYTPFAGGTAIAPPGGGYYKGPGAASSNYRGRGRGGNNNRSGYRGDKGAGDRGERGGYRGR
ncbi:hypothetical protein MMC09_006476 [Bachmanniomyces sp. S44760]|nr:hypothetical protein [Bachmanniomyces sp. S44760]